MLQPTELFRHICAAKISNNYYIVNPELACVDNAKFQLALLFKLLENGAKKAKEIIANFDAPFKSIKEYFALSFNQEEIQKLKDLGINTLYTGPKVETNENFYNKTFVITGTLEKYTRDEIEEKIQLLGGKTSSSVSKKTSAVIVGSNPGSKYEKAQKLDVPIWSEEDFDKLINE